MQSCQYCKHALHLAFVTAHSFVNLFSEMYQFEQIVLLRHCGFCRRQSLVKPCRLKQVASSACLQRAEDKGFECHTSCQQNQMIPSCKGVSQVHLHVYDLETPYIIITWFCITFKICLHRLQSSQHGNAAPVLWHSKLLNANSCRSFVPCHTSAV